MAKTTTAKDQEAAEEPSEEQVAEAEAYTKAEQKHYQDIKVKELSVGMLLDLYETVKAEAALAKRVFEQADVELRAMIRKGPDPQQTLSFGDEAVVPNDAWRGAFLVDLVPYGFPASAVEKFNTHVPALANLGNVVDWLATTYENNRLTDIKGIGEETAAKYDDASVAYFDAHPEFAEKIGESKPKEDETAAVA